MVTVGFYAVVLFMAIQDLRILRKWNAKKDIAVYVVFMLIAAALTAAWFAIPGEWGLSELLLKKR